MKKVLVFTLLAALSLAVPVLAQGPLLPLGGGPQGAPGGPLPQGVQQPGPPPEAVLKDVLGLTDDQLIALKALLDARKVAVEAIVPQLADAEKALGDALKAANPDAAQLGTLLLKVQGFRAQLDQANDTFRIGFKNLLTAAQLQKVEQILALQKALQVADALHRLGI